MSVTPSGGTFPYSYNWYDADGTPTDSFANGQCAGIYNVEFEDSLACVDTANIVLNQPTLLEHTIRFNR